MMRGILFLIASTSFYACANGPSVPIVMWSQSRQEFNGTDADGKSLTIDPKDPATDRYLREHKLVCTTDVGEKDLLDWMKRHCK